MRLENGKYGLRAVLDSEWSDDMLETLSATGVAELELNIGKGWRGHDINFVSRLPGLKSFEIFNFGIRDITPIHALRELRRLGVTTYCSTPIDFSAFPDLESCDLEWRPTATSVFERATLKSLFIDRYDGKDTEPFGRLVNLESLQILGAPVESVEGLRSLVRLRSLRLANLRRLKSLAGIEALTNLEELEVHTCRAVSSIDEVAALRKLRKLHLNNNGSIASLKPIDNLSGLETVGFYESTNILDGDLSPLLRQKKLSCLSFQNRRHYSHRREEFAAYWA
jgi:Leucine-rich repeat (LRR) protein